METPYIAVIRRVRKIVEYTTLRIRPQGHTSIDTMKDYALNVSAVHPTLSVAVKEDFSQWEVSSITSEQEIEAIFLVKP
jgi:hypothetical protein